MNRPLVIATECPRCKQPAHELKEEIDILDGLVQIHRIGWECHVCGEIAACTECGIALTGDETQEKHTAWCGKIVTPR